MRVLDGNGYIAGEYMSALTEGVTTDRVVKHLVEQGMPVFEIALHEETLEEFYLSLMRGRKT